MITSGQVAASVIDSGPTVTPGGINPFDSLDEIAKLVKQHQNETLHITHTRSFVRSFVFVSDRLAL